MDSDGISDARGCSNSTHVMLAAARNKWLDAGIRDVVGVDLSPNEIKEAERRCLLAPDLARCTELTQHHEARATQQQHPQHFMRA